MRILVVSDTHIGPSRRYRLPSTLIEQAGTADLILHGGDVTDPDVLLELGAYAPVHTVLGNNDPPGALLPETFAVELGETFVGMVHDPGPERGRRARLRKLFPYCRVVVFGHTHLPFLEDDDGLLLLNPGSPTERRRAPSRSFAWLELDDHGAVSAEIVELPDPHAPRG